MGWCSDHWREQLHFGPKPGVPARRLDRDGYAQIRVGSRWIPEHRAVMQDHIGRELTPGESVHHINGVRDDNRIDNLELWFRGGQPAGQRVDDLIRYAVTFHRAALVRALSEAEPALGPTNSPNPTPSATQPPTEPHNTEGA